MANKLILVAILLAGWISPVAGQSTRLQLALADETRRSILRFESSPDPVPQVLVGFLVPARGPIDAICPLYSGFVRAEKLSTSFAGTWYGRRPKVFARVENPGSVVAGVRVLLVVRGAGVQTRQLQVFWKPWPLELGRKPAPSSLPPESSVYGPPASDRDETIVRDLFLPRESVAVGIYGDYAENSIAQFSLTFQNFESSVPQPSTSVKAVAEPSPPFRSRVKIPTVQPPVLPQTPR